MPSLKLPEQAPIQITKAYFTVGSGTGFDAAVAGTDDAAAFTLHHDAGRTWIIPGGEKVRVNGVVVGKPVPLSSCDRITWRDAACVFLDDKRGTGAAPASGVASECLHILSDLASAIEEEHSLQLTLNKALRAFLRLAGAEIGHLVAELKPGGGWELLASVGTDAPPERQRADLLSNTIVNEAIRRREPIYVESIVGHPWAAQASIVSASLFSVACLPLVVGDRVFGCAYLYTRTPSRSIRKDALNDLAALATQAGILLAAKSQLSRSERENAQLRRTSPQPRSDIIHDGTGAMRELEERLSRLATSDLNLLILGETGSGKELVAREVHWRSRRAAKPFVAVNCGAIPPSLIESTLFGHVKGAFTGAERNQPGKFVQANGGTLFLDEIGDFPVELQVKILRVLQERRVEPIGAAAAVAVDFRIVAATHRSLETAVARGEFRQDLFYRLNGASVRVPPLRERGRDVLLLAEHFLRRIDPSRRLSEGAQARLLGHDWPGNVRELEQTVMRAAALAPGDTITAEDLELGTVLPPSAAPSLEAFENLSNLKEAQLAFTREFVRKTLERCGGVRSKAAGSLGISERTLYRILSAGDGGGSADAIV